MMSGSWIRRWIETNRRISRWQSRIVNQWTGRRNGRADFCDRILPGLLSDGLRVLDVGGGKQPAISLDVKRRLNLHVTGIDICGDELRRAPQGAYDQTIVGDVTELELPHGKFDLAISRAVLEHLPNNDAALANIAAALAAGGVMAHFIPCGNALFARLNQMLGNRTARKVLFAIYPDKSETQGFPAFYHRCTPAKMLQLCSAYGLHDIEVTPYFQSEYFAFFAPAQALELLRQTTLMALGAENLCETFALVARKPIKQRRQAA